MGEVSVPAVLRRLATLAALLAAAPASALADDEPAPAPAPEIALSAPVPHTTLGAGAPATLTAYASGDIRTVSFHLDGGPPLCVFTRVHDSYSCPFTPPPSAIGAHVLQARVQAPDGQVALVQAPIQIGRLLPSAVGARTTRRHVRGGGWRLTTTGTIAVPQGLTAAACGGRATVTVLAGARTVVDRSVPVAADCSYLSRVTVAAPRRARSLRIKVAYDGASLLAPRSAPAQTLKLR
jgi:hypothetical protein